MTQQQTFTLAALLIFIYIAIVYFLGFSG